MGTAAEERWMSGWAVMAAPLAVLVQWGSPVVAFLAVRALWRYSRPDADEVVPDDDIVGTYLTVVDAGWPPRAPATFAEVAVRLGVPVPRVRSTITRDNSVA
jgi:hypothetical protein